MPLPSRLRVRSQNDNDAAVSCCALVHVHEIARRLRNRLNGNLDAHSRLGAESPRRVRADDCLIHRGSAASEACGNSIDADGRDVLERARKPLIDK